MTKATGHSEPYKVTRQTHVGKWVSDLIYLGWEIVAFQLRTWAMQVGAKSLIFSNQQSNLRCSRSGQQSVIGVNAFSACAT
jgi:hypothetical protein